MSQGLTNPISLHSFFYISCEARNISANHFSFFCLRQKKYRDFRLQGVLDSTLNTKMYETVRNRLTLEEATASVKEGGMQGISMKDSDEEDNDNQIKRVEIIMISVFFKGSGILPDSPHQSFYRVKIIWPVPSIAWFQFFCCQYFHNSVKFMTFIIMFILLCIFKNLQVCQ